MFLNDYQETKYFIHDGRNEGFVSVCIGSLENGNDTVIVKNGSNVKMIFEIVNIIATLNQWKNFPVEAQKNQLPWR